MSNPPGIQICETQVLILISWLSRLLNNTHVVSNSAEGLEFET